jgi:hypothetical protein
MNDKSVRQFMMDWKRFYGLTDKDDGNIVYGEKYTPDDAAEAFWTAIGKNSPMKLQKEIDELKEKLDAVNDLNTKLVDNQSTIEDFTLPHISKRIGSLVTELPNDDLEDIRYFRDKLNRALLQGHPTEKAEKQLAVMEYIATTKKAIRNDNCYASDNILGGKQMSAVEGSVFSIKPRYDSPEDSFERAMKVVE